MPTSKLQPQTGAPVIYQVRCRYNWTFVPEIWAPRLMGSSYTDWSSSETRYVICINCDVVCLTSAVINLCSADPFLSANNLFFGLREINCPEEVAACHRAVIEVSLNVTLRSLFMKSFVLLEPITLRWRRVVNIICPCVRREGMWGNGGKALRVLNVETTWRWVFTFTLVPLYCQGKNPRYPLNRKLSGPNSRSGRFGEEKNSCLFGNRTTFLRSTSP